MAGLGWCAQTQWIDRQRELWREHDAKLAAVWREETPAGDDNVIVLPDVREARAGRTQVIVLPEEPREPRVPQA